MSNAFQQPPPATGNRAMMERIMRISLPAIVSNVTVPLLSLADTAIVGHLGSAVYLAAIAATGTIFSVTYWLFHFVRPATSGLTAQAFGGGRSDEVGCHLYRAVGLSLLIGCLLVLLQRPVFTAASALLNGTASMETSARIYYDIVIWGAPAVIGLYALGGWFIGLQATRITMAVAILQNLLNVVLSLLFTYGFGWGFVGVAWGTLTAQYFGLAIALAWVRPLARRHNVELTCPEWRTLTIGMGRFMRVGSDIFMRTLCLISVTMWFTAAGSRQGELTLASNALLMQLFYLFSFFMDGFANAGESLAGFYAGRNETGGLKSAVRNLFIVGWAFTTLATATYFLLGPTFLALLTDHAQTLEAARAFMPWAIVIPAAGCAAFIWDGIFIGLTASRPMLLSMAVATLIFFATYVATRPTLGNHSLWLSFVLYLLIRGIVQSALWPNVKRKTFKNLA